MSLIFESYHVCPCCQQRSLLCLASLAYQIKRCCQNRQASALAEYRCVFLPSQSIHFAPRTTFNSTLQRYIRASCPRNRHARRNPSLFRKTRTITSLVLPMKSSAHVATVENINDLKYLTHELGFFGDLKINFRAKHTGKTIHPCISAYAWYLLIMKVHEHGTCGGHAKLSYCWIFSIYRVWTQVRKMQLNLKSMGNNASLLLKSGRLH